MKKIFTIIAASLFALPVLAQPQKVVADKIVGIVGDKIILRSDVYNEILDRQRKNEPVRSKANTYIK